MSDQTPSREQRLNAILHDYLQAVDAGRAPEKDEIVRRHPDLAEELAAFFADQDRLNRLAQQMRTTGPVDAPMTIRYVGDYELLEEISRGGMGVVYRARQISLNRLVAVKMILSGRLAGPGEVERFRREAGAAARLDHPNIVPIHEVGEHQGHHYYSMKLIEGANLGRDMPHFAANHRAAAHLIAMVARAVQHAHERGILHRDLKPGNILLDAAKQPHVADFGLARRLDEPSSLSPSGAVIGTASYMAPEQAAARSRRLTAAADVYALGAVLYEMLTGRPPFKTENVVQTLRAVVEQEPERPRKLNPRIHPDLEIICLKCLDKRPARRYATAGALADDLESWAEGRPIRARAVGRAERVWLWCRRRPLVAGLGAAAALLLILAAGLIPVVVHKTRTEAETQAAIDRAAAAAQAADIEKHKADEAARQEREGKRRQEYLGDMRLADLAWKGDDYDQVRRLLGKYWPVEPGDADVRGWEWHLLDAVSRGHLATLRGPDPQFRSIASHLLWSPDGQRLAWDVGGRIHVWDAAGRELPTLPVTFNLNNGLPGSWSADGRLLATFGHGAAAYTPAVTVWDVETGRQRFALCDRPDGWDAPVGAAGFAYSPDGRFLATYAANDWNTPPNKRAPVCIWDGSTGKLVRALGSTALPATGAGSAGLAASPLGPGALLAASTLAVGTAETTWMTRLEWSPDGTRLATYDANTVQVWDAARGELLRAVRITSSAQLVRLVLAAPSDYWPRCGWAPDGRSLAVMTPQAASPQQTTRLTFFDAATGEPHGPPLDVRGTAVWKWSRDGRRLALVDTTQSVGVPYGPWGPCGVTVVDAAAARVLFRLQPPVVESLAWSIDDRRLLLRRPDEPEPLAYDADAGTATEARPGDGAVVGCGGIYPGGGVGDEAERLTSPDGRLLARVEKSILHVWDLTAGQRLAPQYAYGGAKKISPDGWPDGWLEVSPKDGLIHDVRTGDIQAWSPDGKRLATGARDGVVKLRTARAGSHEIATAGHAAPVHSLAWSRDSLRLATASVDGVVKLWDPETGKEAARFSYAVRQTIDPQQNAWPADYSHGGPSLAWSPDGGRLAIADDNGPINVWDVEARRVLLTLPGRQGPLRLAWNPAGERLAASCTEFSSSFWIGKITIWDTTTGQELISLVQPNGGGPMAWSADGWRLTSSVPPLATGPTAVWDATPPR